MIADLKPYPEYKESGLAWLGKLPKHWELLPNRAIFVEAKERNHPDEEMLSVTITRGIVKQTILLEGSSKKDSSNLDRSAYKLVLPHDIAYNKMRAWQGAIGVSKLRGIISPAYIVMRLRNTANVPHYFHNLYRTPQFAKEAERWSYGITSDMWSLRSEHFKLIYTPLPPPSEQLAIVRFLDWSNGRLEKAIKAKRKIIALLNEQKQAIIHRAVTRGLDPTVRLKDSGIPWLGKIPEHWQLKRFKFVASITCGQIDPNTAEYRSKILIAPNHIQSNTGKLIKIETADAQGADSGKYIVHKGQVIYSKIRPNLRKACIAPINCLCSAEMYPITPKKAELLPEYLLVLLLSRPFTRFALDASMRVAMPKVNRETLGDCTFWYPTILEQKAILSYISFQTASINGAISRLEREIDLLREYRTRLVADVVTGKLDVREDAATLPDEALADETTEADAVDDEANLEVEEDD